MTPRNLIGGHTKPWSIGRGRLNLGFWVNLASIGLTLITAQTAHGASKDQTAASRFKALVDKAAKEHDRVQVLGGHQQPQRRGPRLSLTIDMHPTPFRPWSLPWVGNFGGKTLQRSPSLEAFAAVLRSDRAWGWTDKPVAYARQAAAMLDSDEPKHRAIAAEFLGLIPQTTIEEGLLGKVGPLLDDETVAIKGAKTPTRSQISTATPKPDVASMTVSDVARAAIEACTAFDFKQASNFHQWWKHARDYQTKLWYWSQPWNKLSGHGYRKANALDTPGLKRLNPMEALRIMLLAGNTAAITAEAHQAFPNEENPPRAIRSSHHVVPDSAMVAAFVDHHHFKAQLLDILAGKIPWPVAKGSAAESLTKDVVAVIEHLATPEDIGRLREALAQPSAGLTQSKDQQTRLTRLIVELAPKREEDILVEQLKRNPSLYRLTADQIRRTGTEHWPLIVRSYKAKGEDDQRAKIIKALARLGDNKAKQRLAQLFVSDDLTGGGPLGDPSGWLEREPSYKAFVQAADTLTQDEPVIERPLLARSLYRHGKMDREALKQANQGVAEARQKVVDKLQQFYLGH